MRNHVRGVRGCDTGVGVRSLLLLLLVCLTLKGCVLFVAFLQQHHANGVVKEQQIERNQFGHRKGCVLVYDGYTYEWRGESCPSGSE